jgi:hypothetical protein
VSLIFWFLVSYKPKSSWLITPLGSTTL